jgi:hypothetical protein
VGVLLVWSDSTSINQNVACGARKTEVSSCSMNVKKRLFLVFCASLASNKDLFFLALTCAEGGEANPQGVAIVSVFVRRGKR